MSLGRFRRKNVERKGLHLSQNASFPRPPLMARKFSTPTASSTNTYTRRQSFPEAPRLMRAKSSPSTEHPIQRRGGPVQSAFGVTTISIASRPVSPTAGTETRWDRWSHQASPIDVRIDIPALAPGDVQPPPQSAAEESCTFSLILGVSLERSWCAKAT